MVFGLGDFNAHVEKRIEGFHGGNGIGKRNTEGRMLLEFVMKGNYVWLICGLRRWTKKRLHLNLE